MKVCSLIFEIFPLLFMEKPRAIDGGRREMSLFWLLLILVFVK